MKLAPEEKANKYIRRTELSYIVHNGRVYEQ